MFEAMWNTWFGDGKVDFLGWRIDPTGPTLAVVILGWALIFRKAGSFVSRLGEDEKLRNKTGNVVRFMIGLWRK